MKRRDRERDNGVQTISFIIIGYVEVAMGWIRLDRVWVGLAIGNIVITDFLSNPIQSDLNLYEKL